MILTHFILKFPFKCFLLKRNFDANRIKLHEVTEVYLESCQASKIEECFVKIVNDF